MTQDNDYLPTADEVAEVSALAQKSAIRQRIEATSGDTASLLGTAADGVHMLLFFIGEFAAAVASAKDLAAIKDAAQPLAELTAPLLKSVAAGETRLPFEVKGTTGVMAKIIARATTVSDAIAPSKDHEEPVKTA